MIRVDRKSQFRTAAGFLAGFLISMTFVLANDSASNSAAGDGTMRMMFLDEPVAGEQFVMVVLDMSGNPIEGAEVTYGNQTVLTGKDGKAVLIAMGGSVGMTVKKAGYDALTNTLSSKSETVQVALTEAGSAETAVQDKAMFYAMAGIIVLLVILILYMSLIRPRRLK